MAQLLRILWVRAGGLVAAGIVVGAAVSFLVFSTGSSVTSVGDRVLFTSGASVLGGNMDLFLGAIDVGEELPLTAAEAMAAGWVDPIFCGVGRGRYFHRGEEGAGDPYFLMYNADDEFIGVYLYIREEMPAPWEHMEGLVSGGVPVVDFEHWGMFVYFKEPTRACTRADEGEGSAPAAIRQPAGQRWQTGSVARGTPTPVVQATPTPTAGAALVAGAKRMSSLTSLSFTLTAGEGGGPLMTGMEAAKVEGAVVLPDQVTLETTEPGEEPHEVSADSLPFRFDGLGTTLAEIMEALQDPVDAPRKWIDNVAHRGFSGSIKGEQLKPLIPSAVPDATAAISLWLGEDGLIRRVEFLGPVAPDDSPEAFRVLELHGFDQP